LCYYCSHVFTCDVTSRTFVRSHHASIYSRVKVVPPFGAGQNLLPIRNRGMVVTQQDE
jgi:hypothetical protein